MERLFTEPDIVSTFSSLVKLLLGDSMFPVRQISMVCQGITVFRSQWRPCVEISSHEAEERRVFRNVS